MVTSLMEPMQCGDERRNAALLDASHPLNGVDYVEYRRDTGVVPGDPHEHRLEVTFLKPPDPTLVASSFQLVGGVRIVGVQVTEIEPATGNPLRLFLYVDRRGDFSTYYLHVDHPSIDDHRSDAAVDFRAGCPTEFDCRPRVDCPPEDLQQPALDYLAKDYQSFRRMMLDLIPGRNPNWTERNPADVGIALVELFAYAGDYLSYFQDAVGTEAYLDSCQHRARYPTLHAHQRPAARRVGAARRHHSIGACRVRQRSRARRCSGVRNHGADSRRTRAQRAADP